MAAIVLASDFLVFDQLPFPDLYELPEWLLRELRFVVGAWNKQQSKENSQ